MYVYREREIHTHIILFVWSCSGGSRSPHDVMRRGTARRRLAPRPVATALIMMITTLRTATTILILKLELN